MAKTYLLRDLDDQMWERVRARAKQDGATIKDVLLALIVAYADERVSVTATTAAATQEASADATGIPH